MTRNAVQLITYADRLAGDLPGLGALLRTEPWASAFGGVHVLPFFTPFDGADAGFDPQDHTAVDPRLGTWQDVAALAESGDTMVDLIVNHVSASSAAFVDVLDKGDASSSAGLFLTMSSVFPDGATEAQLAAVYRPRPGLPLTPYTLGGVKRLVWTTFTSQQIDIDVRSAAGRRYLESVLTTIADAGVSMVRLDAVGYAVKDPGTSCFMTPATFAFIEEFTARARALGVEVLVEVHSYYRKQIEIGAAVDRVYDFALPPLLLHALTTGESGPLVAWQQVRPTNAVTVLDTHDGIGIIDVGPDQSEPDRPGLLRPDQLDALVETIHENTQGQSRLASGAVASNLDIYQVNATYYDALGRDDRRYLLARAIQFFTPGIPQVYYVGVLAGHNDMELLARTGVGRDINRHHYDPAEIDHELQRPVVQALFALCRFRSHVPAFEGTFGFSVDDGGSVLTYRWQHGLSHAQLTADLATSSARIEWSALGEFGTTNDLLLNPPRLHKLGC